MGSYVGIDLHRRRSVVVVLNADGDRVSWSRIDNSPVELARELTAAGPDAEVAMEATWGWYWAADVIAECGHRVHLAHPLGIAAYENRRVKNDIADATLLADLLRMGRLPEAWIAPPEIRELREEVRYRHKLSRLRAGLKSQVHQVLGKEGVIPEMGVIWGPHGQRWLDGLELADAFTNRIESLRDLIEMYDREIDQADARIHRRLRDDPGYRAIQHIGGVGNVLAAVFVAEIGDVHRFPEPARLCSWAGLTPKLPRVRRPQPLRAHHETRITAGALGCGRGRVEPLLRTTPCRGEDPYRGPSWRQYRTGCCGASSPHPRLLRNARRRDPLSAIRRGVSRARPGAARSTA